LLERMRKVLFGADAIFRLVGAKYGIISIQWRKKSFSLMNTR